MAAPAFTPYISFPGTADEAFHYYQEVFGGELEIGHYGDMPTTQFPMDPPAQAVAHAQLHDGLVTLAGGDSMPSPDGTMPGLTSQIYSFLISLDAVETGEALIGKLTDTGAEVTMAFAKAPWGDHYGRIRDRFGVQWDLLVPAGYV